MATKLLVGMICKEKNGWSLKTFEEETKVWPTQFLPHKSQNFRHVWVDWKHSSEKMSYARWNENKWNVPKNVSMTKDVPATRHEIRKEVVKTKPRRDRQRVGKRRSPFEPKPES